MKIIYFGTPSFAAEILDFLIKNGVEVLAIVTKPDKPRGRSGQPAFSAVKRLSVEKYPKIPLYQPDKASTAPFEEKIALYGADLFVVVAYGEIMKQPLLDIPKYDCINLHASLLPKYRGAAPIQFALLDGAKESGVTVIEMVLKMDAGPILAQEKIPIPSEMNCAELEESLCTLGGEVLLRVLRNYPHYAKQKIDQNSQEATYVQKIDSSMAEIDWTQSAEKLHNQIRAFSPRPGAWCWVNIQGQDKRLKIFRAKVSSETQEIFSKKEWVIPCGSGALSLLEVQLEGKKRLDIATFIQGNAVPPKIK